MVNKNRLAVLVVGTLVFTGALALGQPGPVLGPTDDPTPTGSPSATPTVSASPTGTATPSPTTSPTPGSTPTRTPYPTTTPFPSPTPTPASAALDEAAVVAAIEARVGDYRDDPRTADDEALVTDSRTAVALAAIARSHSDAMAAEDRVAHSIDGVAADDRYERSPETDGCYITDDGDDNVLPRTAYEGLFATDVDERDEEELGTAIADGIVTDDHARRALTLDDATVMGVGLNVTDGRAYVTVAVC